MIDTLLIGGLTSLIYAAAKQQLGDTVLTHIGGHVAGHRVNKALGAIGQKILDGLKQRFETYRPDLDPEVQKSLLVSYWVSVLLVVAEHGSSLGVSLPEISIRGLSVSGKEATRKLLNAVLGTSARSWQETIREGERSQIRALYRSLQEKIKGAEEQNRNDSADAIKEFYANIEQLTASGAPVDQALAQLMTARVLSDLRAIHDYLPEGLEERVERDWLSRFVAVFHNIIKTNDRVRSLLYAQLLGDLKLERKAGVSTVTMEELVSSLDQATDEMLAGVHAELSASEERIKKHMTDSTEYVIERLSRPSEPIAGAPRSALINLPNLRTRVYGREREADVLLAELTSSGSQSVVPLVAPPGFGKSEVVRKLLQEVVKGMAPTHPEVQAIVAWDCRDPLTLTRMASMLAGLLPSWDRNVFLEQTTNPARSVGQRIAHLLDALADIGNVWLLWFNAEAILDESFRITDPEIEQFVQLLLTRHHTCRLLIETRLLPVLGSGRLEPSRASETLRNGMPPETALAWLQAARRDLECLSGCADTLLKELAQRVHFVPLWIQSVISYVQAVYPHTTLARILADHELFAAFEHEEPQLRLSGFRAVVAKHFASLSEGAKSIVSFLALVGFSVPAEALAAAVPKDEGIRWIPALVKSGIVTTTGHEQSLTYEMNAAIQDVIISLPDMRMPSLEVAHRCATLAKEASRTGRFERGLELDRCVIAVCRVAGQASVKESLMLSSVAWWQTAHGLRALGRPADAIEALKEAEGAFASRVQIERNDELNKGQSVPTRPPLSTALLVDLADLYLDLFRSEECVATCTRTITRLGERLLEGHGHPENIANMAEAYLRRAQAKSGLRHTSTLSDLRAAHKIAKGLKILDAKRSQVLLGRIAAECARAYAARGSLRKAARESGEAIRIYQSLGGEADSILLAEALFIRADVLRRGQRIRDALKCANDSVQMLEAAILVREHDATRRRLAWALEVKGLCHKKLKDLPAARSALTKAVDIFQQIAATGGPEQHIKLAMAREELAPVLRELEELAEAAKQWELSAHSWEQGGEKRFKGADERRAAALANAGSLLMTCHDSDSGIKLMKEALEGFKRISSPGQVVVRLNLVGALMSLNRAKEASEELAIALKLLDSLRSMTTDTSDLERFASYLKERLQADFKVSQP